MPNTREEKIIDEMKRRFNIAVEASREQRKRSSDDLRFCDPAQQWPSAVRVEREQSGKPVYTSDRLNAQVKQLSGAQRENRPAVTVHAVSSKANKSTAEVFQGIIRHIEYSSAADAAYDTAFESCVRIGFGFWRLITEYESSNSFDQVIKVNRIANPFQVYIDPSYKQADGSDIDWCFIAEDLSKDEFDDLYPDSELMGESDTVFYALGDKAPGWISAQNKTVRVVEYFVKNYKQKTICKLDDESVVDKKELDKLDYYRIVSERPTQEIEIRWYKCTGNEILEENVWPGKYIPIIPVFGDEFNENGISIYSGLIRNSKDEQQQLNIMKTAMTEMIAMAPKTPWVGPAGFVGNRKAEWQNANKVNYAYLEYEVVNDQGEPLPPPSRNVQEPAIQTIIQAIAGCEQDIKATNGMYDPSLGNKMSNSQSGRAIKALQTQGSIGNYHFSDNLSRAIRLEALMLLDLIPYVYDTKRVIRIVGLDESHKLVTINGDGSEEGNDVTGSLSEEAINSIYDMTTGTYDVTVSSGPSYQTKRAENLDMLFDLAGKDPALMQVAGDLIVSQMDSPVATQLQERLAKTLPDALKPKDSKQAPGLPPEISRQMEDMAAMITELTNELNKTHTDFSIKKMELDSKERIALLENQTELVKAEIATKSTMGQLAFKEEMAMIHNRLAKEDAQSLQAEQLNMPQEQPIVPEQTQVPGNVSEELPEAI